MTTLENLIYVSFHIGRGGQFHNQGHKSFIGELDYEDLVRENVNDGKLFIVNSSYDPETDTETELPREEWYATDGAGNVIIEAGELDRKTGRINFDGDYDTDYASTTDDLDEEEWEILTKEYEDAVTFMTEKLKKEIEKYISEKQMGERKCLLEIDGVAYEISLKGKEEKRLYFKKGRYADVRLEKISMQPTTTEVGSAYLKIKFDNGIVWSHKDAVLPKISEK